MGKPTYDELRSLYDDMEKQKIENEFIIEELENRIYESINYINHHTYLDSYSPKYNEKYFSLDDNFDFKHLINILRGIK